MQFKRKLYICMNNDIFLIDPFFYFFLVFFYLFSFFFAET